MAGRTQNENPQDMIRRGSIAPPMFNLPPQLGPGIGPANRLNAAEAEFASSVARRRANLLLPKLFRGIGR